MKSPEKQIKNILKDQRFTLSIAESLTGGNISKQIVTQSGASDYFTGSVIAYDNSIKQSLLNVSSRILNKNGAVSEECATAMVKGIHSLFNTQVSLSVTGIAGPGGGTHLKPVGLVYAGFIIQKNIFVKRYLFKGTRLNIIKETTKNVLTDLLIFLNKTYK